MPFKLYSKLWNFFLSPQTGIEPGTFWSPARSSLTISDGRANIWFPSGGRKHFFWVCDKENSLFFSLANSLLLNYQAVSQLINTYIHIHNGYYIYIIYYVLYICWNYIHTERMQKKAIRQLCEGKDLLAVHFETWTFN